MGRRRRETGYFKYRTNMDKHQQQSSIGNNKQAGSHGHPAALIHTSSIPPVPAVPTSPGLERKSGRWGRPRLVRWSEGHAYSLGPNGPQGSAHSTHDKGG